MSGFAARLVLSGDIQEGWLSLSASIFDMAIYPAIFVLYLGKFNPGLTAGWHGYAWSVA